MERLLSECSAGQQADRAGAPPRCWLTVELILLFVAWPAMGWFLEGWWKFFFFVVPLLFAASVYLRARPPAPVRRWSWRAPALRLALALPALALITHWLVPQGWFAFPRERPFLWAIVMVLYPFFSALPQEFLYRRYFFWRYELLTGTGAARVFINAALFGWLHVIYENWPAVLLSAIGGLFFAATYAQTKNLTLVWVEHTLYGQAVFTLGLGRFFYTGAT